MAKEVLLTYFLFRKHIELSIEFSILVLSVTTFLLIEQLLITDGTVPPLNRLRIIYAIGAAVALLIFGISSAIEASRLNYHTDYYRSKIENILFPRRNKSICVVLRSDMIVAAVIAFIGVVVYAAEAIFRNQKTRLI